LQSQSQSQEQQLTLAEPEPSSSSSSSSSEDEDDDSSFYSSVIGSIFPERYWMLESFCIQVQTYKNDFENKFSTSNLSLKLFFFLVFRQIIHFRLPNNFIAILKTATKNKENLKKKAQILLLT
jgi:hypothetical protein